MTEDIVSQDNGKPRNQASKTQAEKAKAPPKKITETYLHNAGLYYLGRFAASRARFRIVMIRKVRKSCAFHTDQNPVACEAMVDALIRKFETAGLLGDELYTKGVVQSLRRRGKSKRHILESLKAKGIDPALARHELTRHDTDFGQDPAQAERQAALAYARKKKLGPFGKHNNQESKKDLSSMARAGFSYETARSVLDSEIEESALFSDMP